MSRTAVMTRAILLLGSLCVVWPFATVRGQSSPDAGAASRQGAAAPADGQHDFDFEFGTWKAHVRRMVRPLSGDHTWAEYDGTSVVRKVWDGRANLGELEVTGPKGRIEGLTLRLYNPDTRQWNISWANAKDGSLGNPPMSGGFVDGRGEFYDQEMMDGRAVRVRFVFSNISEKSFTFEQAFSDDFGKTWEVNWVATFTR